MTKVTRLKSKAAAHGGTDYKELEIETVTLMGKLLLWLLLRDIPTAAKLLVLMFLNEPIRKVPDPRRMASLRWNRSG